MFKWSDQLGSGVSDLLSELMLDPVMHLHIDNAATQGLAGEAPGTWKTRHLRIRARFLRQEVAAQRLVISHVSGNLQKADLGTKGFDLPKFKALMDLWQIVPCSFKEAAGAALRVTNQRRFLMFIIVCCCLISKGVEGRKDDLALDGSMEFYFVLVVSLIAAVGLWEFLKYVKNKTWLCGGVRGSVAIKGLKGSGTARGMQCRRSYGGVKSSSRLGPRQPGLRRLLPRQATTAIHRNVDLWQTSCNVGVQTDPLPAMIPANRLEAYTGPFYITAHGDRVHMTSYCHGQRKLR